MTLVVLPGKAHFRIKCQPILWMWLKCEWKCLLFDDDDDVVGDGAGRTLSEGTQCRSRICWCVPISTDGIALVILTVPISILANICEHRQAGMEMCLVHFVVESCGDGNPRLMVRFPEYFYFMHIFSGSLFYMISPPCPLCSTMPCYAQIFCNTTFAGLLHALSTF